ncbi:hypothetical protein Hsc_0422 [Herbaspirillum seropedicae]|nr:hypothetical protein Hsc_0422 [Herbaspirillum seropedicae]
MRAQKEMKGSQAQGPEMPAATATPDDASHPTGCMLGGMRDWQEKTRRSRCAVSKPES